MFFFTVFFSFFQAFSYTPPNNKQLVIGYTQELETLHPLLVTSAYGAYAQRIVNRALFSYGHNGKVPQLVEKIPSFDNGLARFVGKGKEKKIITRWKIRANARWADGTAITSADVLFAWRVATDSKVGTPFRSEYQRIQSVVIDIDNPKAFEFIHSQIEWNYADIDFFLLPSHIEKPIYEKDPAKYLNLSQYVTQPTNPALYNGPYTVSERKLGSHLVVSRNRTFFGKQAKIQEIVYKVIPHSSALDSHLRSGTIDMAATYALSIDQGVALEARYKKEKIPLQLNARSGIFTDGLYLNPDHKALADPGVRKAIRFSLRLEDISYGLFSGKQKPAHHFLPPAHAAYPSVKSGNYKYSLRRARQLLKDSGWAKNKQGIFEKNGKPLKLVFKTAAGKRDRERVQVYVKQQLTQLGLNIEIKNEPIRVLYGESLPKGDFDLLLGATGFNNSANPIHQFHSRNIPQKNNKFTGQNMSRWSNSKVDSLSEKFDQEFDGKVRTEILAEIIDEFHKDMPWIPLFRLSELSMTPVNLSGYSLLGNGYPPTEFVEHWSLEVKPQKK